MATTDTTTDYTINKTPLPLAATAYPMRTMRRLGVAPWCVVGGASMRWPVVDVGGDGAALPRMAFWPSVDGARVLRQVLHTTPSRQRCNGSIAIGLGIFFFTSTFKVKLV